MGTIFDKAKTTLALVLPPVLRELLRQLLKRLLQMIEAAEPQKKAGDLYADQTAADRK